MLWPYVEGSPLGRTELDAMVGEAYATFDHPDVCPLVEIEPGLHVVELFHGPTLAFKDVALQLVGRLFDHELARRGERATIVVATSGDTGSAAIAACVGRPALDIVVLHPAGRVSDVQRRQMTTVDAPNVHNVAVEGTFDDCQDLVKALFADAALRERVGPVGHELDQLGPRRRADRLLRRPPPRRRGPCDVAVPTGNFGNVFAGWIARPGRGARSSGCHRLEQQRHPHPLGRHRRAWPSSAWCPRSARAWTSRCRPTTSACCSSCWAATAPPPPS